MNTVTAASNTAATRIRALHFRTRFIILVRNIEHRALNIEPRTTEKDLLHSTLGVRRSMFGVCSILPIHASIPCNCCNHVALVTLSAVIPRQSPPFHDRVLLPCSAPHPPSDSTCKFDRSPEKL